MNVQAAVVASAGADPEIRPLWLSAPRHDEILVDIRACGICHTDLVIQGSSERTPKPVVLGHEGAGIVLAVGEAVRHVAPGDHVVLSFDSCGQCSRCNGGHPAYCTDMGRLNFSGHRLDGSTSLADVHGVRIGSHFFGQSAFATRAVVSGRSAVKVPRHLDPRILAPLGCGIQTGAGAVMNSLNLARGESIAVYGAGSVGLAAVMAARIRAASTIVAVDIVQSRLELALELGATHVVNPGRENPSEALARIAPGGLGFALETTGQQDVFDLAIEHLAAHGTCGLVGAPRKKLELDARQLMVAARRVVGIVEGDSDAASFIPYLISLYEAGEFPVDRLIRPYRFDEINAAIEQMKDGSTIKPVLVMPAAEPELAAA